MDSDFLRPKALSEISKSTRIKEFPTHYDVCVASRNVFVLPGYELRKSEDSLTAQRGETKDNARALLESLRRARQSIRDIVACSAFTHFVTLTLDSSKVDRYDYNEIMQRVNRWLSNAVQRQGLSYVLIPEHHKDGALHFHGLFREEVAGSLSYLDSGRKTNRGQAIYNLKNWRFGFSACIELDGEYAKVVSYIQKYITKESQKVGGRWYLSGGALARPRVSYADLDFSEIDAEEYRVPKAGVAFKYLKIDKNSDLSDE